MQNHLVNDSRWWSVLGQTLHNRTQEFIAQAVISDGPQKSVSCLSWRGHRDPRSQINDLFQWKAGRFFSCYPVAQWMVNTKCSPTKACRFAMYLISSEAQIQSLKYILNISCKLIFVSGTVGLLGSCLPEVKEKHELIQNQFLRRVYDSVFTACYLRPCNHGNLSHELGELWKHVTVPVGY